MIGRAWAIVFARAGCDVRLFDVEPTAIDAALPIIRERLRELQAAGLAGDGDAAFPRVRPAASLAATVEGAGYVQENLPESVDIKRAVFAELDRLARPDAVLASSTSAIPASAFTEELQGRERCLVAHPANPPYLLPMVELCGAPWTAPGVIQRASEFLASAGMEPVHVRREIPGFILNRIQGALLNEAFRLVDEGYVTPEDLDKTVKHGLGLRWSFMGPFETIDLNAPGGVRDYCARYGPCYQRMRADPPSAEPWPEALIDALDAERRAIVPMDQHAERQAWRDRRLIQLGAHKRRMEAEESGGRELD